METPVVAYISGHGLGHAARCAEVLRSLRVLRPDLGIRVRSTAAPWFLRERLPADIVIDAVPTDVGVLQPDSFGADPRGSLEAYARLIECWDVRVAEEAAELERFGARVVLADIPPLGIAAGRAAHCRTTAMGNFGWDWIYQPYLQDLPQFDTVVAHITAIYELTDELFRLPLAEPMLAFPHRLDVPLIARRSERDPRETRQVLGIRGSQRLVLLSFGGFGAGEIGRTLDPADDIRFVGGEWERAAFPPSPLSYTDVVAAADAVVTKPGFSLFAECLAHGTPIIFVPRARFAEADLLVEELARLRWPRAELRRESLVSGEWVREVRSLLDTLSRAEPQSATGAELVARRLLEACQLPAGLDGSDKGD